MDMRSASETAKLRARAIFFREGRSAVRDREATVRPGRHLDPVRRAGMNECRARWRTSNWRPLIEICDERLWAVVLLPAWNRVVVLPEIQKARRRPQDLERLDGPSLPRAVVHDSRARPQRMDEGSRA